VTHCFLAPYRNILTYHITIVTCIAVQFHFNLCLRVNVNFSQLATRSHTSCLPVPPLLKVKSLASHRPVSFSIVGDKLSSIYDSLHPNEYSGSPKEHVSLKRGTAPCPIIRQISEKVQDRCMCIPAFDW